MSRPGSLLSAFLRLLGAALLALTAFGAPTHAASRTGSLDAPALAGQLSADGTLAPGASGSFDASGYAMTLGANGEPRFVPAPAAAPGDEGWDDRFGTPGTYNANVYALAAAPNGDIYVGGWFTSIPGIPDANGLLRWDGSRWHALGTGIRGSGQSVRSIAVDDNLVYVAGDFTNAGDVAAKGIAVWNGQSWAPVGDGTGVCDMSYGNCETGYLYAVAVAPNGAVYVGGHFNTIDGVAAEAVARWDGQGWHALGAGIFDLGEFEGAEPMDGVVYALAIAGDGTVYAGGRFNRAGSVKANAVASWNGSDWSALSSGLTTGGDFESNGDVRALAYGNGVLYAGGSFNKAGGANAKSIAAWNGTAWSALSSGISYQFESSPPVTTLALNDGVLYAGGQFDSAGGKSIAGVARWNGTAWSAVGDGANVLNQGSGAIVNALTIGVDGLFAAGQIDKAGTRYVFGMARWDGQSWDSLGDGVAKYGDSPAEIRSIAIDDAGRVYIAGWISQVGGIPVNNVAMWDGEEWHDMAGGVKGGGNFIRVVLAVGDEVFVGGDFSEAGGIPTINIARWTISTQTWSAVGTGIDGDVRALTFGDGLLFAGGQFDSAGGGYAKNIAIWDGAKWSGLGGPFEIFEIFDTGAEKGTYVNALAYANGRIYAGGYFQTIHEKGAGLRTGYVVVHNMVSYELDTEKWYVVGTLEFPGVTFNNSSGFGVYVNALAYVNGSIYVGGEFNKAGNTSARNLARYDIAANQWSSPGATGGAVDTEAVYGLTAFGNDLFVAGAFTTIGTVPARYVARYNIANNQWSTLGSGLRWYNDRFTEALSVAVGADGVYVGGQFDYAGQNPSLGFARWAGDVGNPDVTPEAGGAKQFGDGTRAELPAGAVNKPAVLSYASLPGAPHPAPAGQAIARGFQFGVQTLNGQALALAKPATLSIPFTDAQLAQVGITDASKLNVLVWDGSAWQPLLPCPGCGVDVAARTITLATTEGGTFAIAGPSNKAPGQAYSAYLPLVRK